MILIRLLFVFYVVLLAIVCKGQDTLHFVYATSAVDTAVVTFKGGQSSLRYEKGIKISRKNTEMPVTFNQSEYRVRHLRNGRTVGIFQGDQQIFSFSGDTIFSSSGEKYLYGEYSHLKWSYKLEGKEVAVCRHYTENKIKHIILELIGSPADRELLTLLALDKARFMINQNQWYNYSAPATRPASHNFPPTPSAPIPKF
jgi:hypothetical protein